MRYSACADNFGLWRLNISRPSPFKHHRFPRDIILCAVRWYLRFPLSYQDVVDLLEERGIVADRSTIYRRVQKFAPELTKRTETRLRRASLDWHVDETYIRVGRAWRYLWRAIDANDQMVDFRPIAAAEVEAECCDAACPKRTSTT